MTRRPWLLPFVLAVLVVAAAAFYSTAAASDPEAQGISSPAWQTNAFRLTVLVGFVAVLGFMWRVLDAVRSKAMLEQRVVTHLNEADRMVPEFRAMQTAVAESAVRFTGLVQRLDAFVEVQKETNRTLHESIRTVHRRVDEKTS